MIDVSADVVDKSTVVELADQNVMVPWVLLPWVDLLLAENWFARKNVNTWIAFQ